jgi:hypothetical protein
MTFRRCYETSENARWRYHGKQQEKQMATQAAKLPRQESEEERFSLLADQWRKETRFVSSSTELVLNSAYQQIVGMGRSALPLILRSLSSQGGHWFWALKHISGEDPLSPEDAGNYEKNREAWLAWGREHHYL